MVETLPPAQTVNDSEKVVQRGASKQTSDAAVDFAWAEDLRAEPAVRPITHSSSEILTPVPEPVGPHGTGTYLTLPALEHIALQNNPAIQQASASVHKAQGYREQVGKRPNPVVGYNATQLADRGTDQHTVFLEQNVVLGGKLALNQEVLDQEVQSQLWEVETQRRRVLTDVRMQFYEALAAQRRRELAAEFHGVAEEGVRIAEVRKEALEASLPEVLQAEIQLNEVDVLVQKSEVAFQAAWQGISAVAGVPYLAADGLEGSLRVNFTPQDWDARYHELATMSPEIHAACARVARARALLERQKVQPIPNLEFMFAAGYDQGTDSEMINLQAGLPIPVFNRNDGNISAAYGEYCRASQEVRRLQLSLKARLARTARQYDSASIAVDRYENQILPKARQTLNLSEQAYVAGEFGFLEVLVARRTFFDSNLRYVDALEELALSQTELDGMLLTGGLNETPDTSFDDGLRGQALDGQ